MDQAEPEERGQYPTILTEQAWPIKDLLYGFNVNDGTYMVATGQEMVTEKNKFFKVREMSGNFFLGQGKLAF